MSGRLKEMVALQEVQDASSAMPKKAVTPTRFYALSSGVLVALGTYLIAFIFSTVATSAFDLRTADLIIQANFVVFLLVSLGLLAAPFLKLQRFQVLAVDDVQLFHYQEAAVILVGMLFLNIPLLFLAQSVSLYEAMAHYAVLSEEVQFYFASVAPYNSIPQASDVAVCAGFGMILLAVKGWVFKRVAKRFIQGKRYRAMRGELR